MTAAGTKLAAAYPALTGAPPSKGPILPDTAVTHDCLAKRRAFIQALARQAAQELMADALAAAETQN